MSAKRNAAPEAFEPEFVAALTELFEERIPFNAVLGLRIDSLARDGVAGHLAMRPELIGHYAHQRLHGGVISATLDAMAGLAVMAAIGARFALRGEVLRLGSRVATTRMEFADPDGKLLATGSSAYIVS
ncbi:MAG: thioesterase family protein [Rhizobacter sp.]|nr:thioesterase family protein [Rhizobacter sp.]